ncbi:hypothetical protein BOTBODRAFT_405489 [Botryobasidium botryosum FD-172 SS1]|uniref:Uncharacterized protein n=1 Tax=Botryobasidium botryosum (strain FD-172 SS1) TaxID=930990 RepID=A0A067MM37_BOTB1|nr:hypothetical protein BOTBODRAFT_405489 [Botryobasidium botryosum FD-172 SS1]
MSARDFFFCSRLPATGHQLARHRPPRRLAPLAAVPHGDHRSFLPRIANTMDPQAHIRSFTDYGRVSALKSHIPSMYSDTSAEDSFESFSPSLYSRHPASHYYRVGRDDHDVDDQINFASNRASALGPDEYDDDDDDEDEDDADAVSVMTASRLPLYPAGPLLPSPLSQSSISASGADPQDPDANGGSDSDDVPLSHLSVLGPKLNHLSRAPWHEDIKEADNGDGDDGMSIFGSRKRWGRDRSRTVTASISTKSDIQNSWKGVGLSFARSSVSGRSSISSDPVPPLPTSPSATYPTHKPALPSRQQSSHNVPSVPLPAQQIRARAPSTPTSVFLRDAATPSSASFLPIPTPPRGRSPVSSISDAASFYTVSGSDHLPLHPTNMNTPNSSNDAESLRPPLSPKLFPSTTPLDPARLTLSTKTSTQSLRPPTPEGMRAFPAGPTFGLISLEQAREQHKERSKSGKAASHVKETSPRSTAPSRCASPAPVGPAKALNKKRRGGQGTRKIAWAR